MSIMVTDSDGHNFCHLCLCVCLCIYVCMCVCVYIYVCVCVCVCVCSDFRCHPSDSHTTYSCSSLMSSQFTLSPQVVSLIRNSGSVISHLTSDQSISERPSAQSSFCCTTPHITLHGIYEHLATYHTHTKTQTQTHTHIHTHTHTHSHLYTVIISIIPPPTHTHSHTSQYHTGAMYIAECVWCILFVLMCVCVFLNVLWLYIYWQWRHVPCIGVQMPGLVIISHLGLCVGCTLLCTHSSLVTILVVAHLTLGSVFIPYILRSFVLFINFTITKHIFTSASFNNVSSIRIAVGMMSMG